VSSAPPIPTQAEPESGNKHRRTLERVVALSFLMFALDGVVGAWVGSPSLLAAAALFLTGAWDRGVVIMRGGLEPSERRYMDRVLAIVLAAVSIAAVGELVRRMIFGGAAGAVALVWTAIIGLLVSLFCASRLLKLQSGWGGSGGLWRLAWREASTGLLILAAAGIVALVRSRWPDVIAAVIITALNWRRVAGALSGIGFRAAPRK
jgi:Co/Zn/Cd efflux system component